MDNNNQDEIFYLKNFIPFFKSRNISIKTLYIHEERIVFIHASYDKLCNDVWIYITSQHIIKADNTNFPKIILSQPPEDFQLPDSSLLVKEYLNHQLKTVEKNDKNIKLLGIHKKYIIYITRHNEIDYFEVLEGSYNEGFYFMTEWKNFAKNFNEIGQSINTLHNNLIDNIYSNLDNYTAKLTELHNYIKILLDELPIVNKVSRKLIDRKLKIDNLLILAENNPEKYNDIHIMSRKIQMSNLDKIFKTFTILSTHSKINKIF